MSVCLKGYIKDHIGITEYDSMGQIFNEILADINERISPDDFNSVLERSIVDKVITDILNIKVKYLWLSKEVDDSKFEDMMEKSVLFDWETPKNKTFEDGEYFLLEKYFTEEDAVVVYAKFKD